MHLPSLYKMQRGKWLRMGEAVVSPPLHRSSS
jgi:hypothetical protein